MTNSTQDMARDCARATLTAEIIRWLATVADEKFDILNAVRMYNAIYKVLNYVETCEESGITMHPADVRRLIASALGVSS